MITGFVDRPRGTRMHCYEIPSAYVALAIARRAWYAEAEAMDRYLAPGPRLKHRLFDLWLHAQRLWLRVRRALASHTSFTWRG